MKNLIVANLEDNLCLTECVNTAIKVMRFTIHTGLKLTPFELHHGRKPRTELTSLGKNSKSFLSDWTELSVSAEKKPKIPIYVSRDEDGDITNYLVMAKTKAEEKAVDKQSKKKTSVSKYPFKVVEKNYNRKSLEGKFQKKIQTAVSNRTYRNHRQWKRNSPKTHSGTNCISDRKEKRTGTANRRQNHTEKSTLPPRRRRKLYSVERNTSQHTEWKTENYPKPDTKL